jgi:predicted acylesterase/phospholipase RssA
MASRALVLQGGGPLGAYEAGAYRALYDSLSKQIKDNENIFDIIAGTSIGAINAAIIVSHVVENRKQHPSWSVLKCWEGSVEKLEKFWKERISSDPDLRWTPYSTRWKEDSEREGWRRIYPRIATTEAARRYYSAKEFLRKGAKNVFTPEQQFPLYDEKFLDNNRVDDINNLWFRYSNYPLKESIKDYATFPIKTDPDKNEPRLLLVTVDIEEGETVTFDSYSKRSEYGKYNDERKSEYKHTINYDHGLMVEHVMASASIPLLYDFQRVPKKYDYTKAERGQEQGSSPENSRPFWDGALLSNTPTRELINHHKLFWEHNTKPTTNGKTVYQMRTEQNNRKREEYAEELFELLWKEMRATAATTTTGSTETQQKQSKLKAPDLDLYIVNLWPTKEEPFIQNNDYDLTKDRMFDVINHDKTGYDLKVAKFVTDYIELTRNLIQQLSKVGDKEVVRKILLDDSKTESKFREGMPRKYLDLLIGRFDVNEKLKLERKEHAEDTISNKWVDLTRKTVMHLIGQGRKDCKEIL